jgi:hypothetical protein
MLKVLPAHGKRLPHEVQALEVRALKLPQLHFYNVGLSVTY